MINLNLSKEGNELALMSIAFSAAKAAAAKALGELNEERRAAQGDPDDPDSVDKLREHAAIDRYSDFANSVRERELDDDARANPDDDMPTPTNESHRDSGTERKVSFVEYCVLLAAINDELEKLSRPTGTGKRWPIPQSTTAVVDWMKRASPAKAAENQIEAMRAMVVADTGSCNLTDEELLEMATEENQVKAEYFANMYIEHGDDIVARIDAGILNYNRFSETSWETLFSNLPSRIQYTMLGGVDFKLDDKCYELKTGKLRSGKRSAGAGRPILVRASEVSILRADQVKVKAERERLAAMGGGDITDQAISGKPKGTTVHRPNDGPSYDKQLAAA